MKIFRGPSTKVFGHPEHELVAEIDAAKSATFVDDALVLVANVTKDPNERQAIAHFEISSADLLALHQRSLTGLAAKASESDRLKARMSEASTTLYQLYGRLDRGSSFDDIEGKLEELGRLIADACDVVGSLAADLDLRSLRK